MIMAATIHLLELPEFKLVYWLQGLAGTDEKRPEKIGIAKEKKKGKIDRKLSSRFIKGGEKYRLNTNKRFLKESRRMKNVDKF